jgi:glycosyltransferase involved in cell wall biosynthesis
MTTPLKVAFRITNPNGWTGGLNYVLNICRVLRAHAPEIQPVVFASPDTSPDLARTIEAASGAPPIPLRDGSRRGDLLSMVGLIDRAAVEAFKSAGIDVVFEATGYYGPRPPFAVVSWIPDFQNKRLAHLFSRSQKLIRDLRYRLILGTRRHVMVSSQDSYADLAALYGAPRKGQVHVIPFALRVDRPPTWQDGETARLALELPERFVFLPNQFWIHKNHRLVVEALGLLPPERRPVVAASGLAHDPRSPTLVPDLRARIAELGVGDQFRMLGILKFPDILALNARADALINPSLFEGWSTTVEEAKALGTPMALSSLRVHREQVGEGALFFDPRDPSDCAKALEAIVDGPPRARERDPAVTERSLAAQKVFAEQLRCVFAAAAQDR